MRPLMHTSLNAGICNPRYEPHAQYGSYCITVPQIRLEVLILNEVYACHSCNLIVEMSGLLLSGNRSNGLSMVSPPQNNEGTEQTLVQGHIRTNEAFKVL